MTVTSFEVVYLCGVGKLIFNSGFQYHLEGSRYVPTWTWWGRSKYTLIAFLSLPLSLSVFLPPLSLPPFLPSFNSPKAPCVRGSIQGLVPKADRVCFRIIWRSTLFIRVAILTWPEEYNRSCPLPEIDLRDAYLINKVNGGLMICLQSTPWAI